MAGQGFLGNLYYSITGEDKLEEILRKDKKLAEEVAKIAGGIKIGRTAITNDYAKALVAEQKAAEAQARAEAVRNESMAKTAIFEQRLQTEMERTNAARVRAEVAARRLSKTEDTAAGSIKMLEAELKKLKDTYRSLAEADRNSPLGQTMLKQINEADENLAKINAQMANNANLAKVMGTQYNGLRTQIGMVARELPNLGISLSTFILSLSNNLPYLADEIAKARKEYDNLIKTNQKATPVWKQMIGAVFNWQTALIVGVTALVAYSREIQAWVQEMFASKKAIDANIESLEEFQKKAGEISGGTMATFKRLTAEWNNLGDNLKEKEKYIIDNQDAFSSLNVSITTVEQAENLFIGNKKAFEDSIIARAKALAALSALTENYSKVIEKTTKIESLPDVVEKKMAEGSLFDQLVLGRSRTVRYANPAKAKLQEEVKELNKESENIINVYLKNQEEAANKIEESNVDIINKFAEGSVGAIEASIALKRKALKNLNNPEDYKEGLAEIEKLEKQIEAITGGKKVNIDYNKLGKDVLTASKVLEDAVRKSERDIEQTRINLMEEGGEKQLAQLRLNYKKRMDEVEKQTNQYVKITQDQELKEWKKNNPTKKESEYSYKTVDYKTLPKEFQDIIDEMIEIENQLYEKSIQDYFDSVAKGFRGYLEKREAVEKEFAEKRKTLVQSGASQSSISELDYQEEEALQKIDLEFAQRQQNFQAWANQIATMSLEQLKQLLTEAQAELSKMEKSHPENGNALAVYRAKVATLRDQIDKIEITPNKKGKDANKEWQELYKTLNEINGSFQEIGNTVGGTAGEIIKTAGRIASSTLQIVKGIQTLAQNSATAIQGTAVAASTAISTVEKASVILAIISAALQVAMAIVNLFKRDDYMEKFRKEIKQLNYELFLFKINSKIDAEKGNIFGDDNWKNAIKNIGLANDALVRYNETLNKIAKRRKYEGPVFELGKIENINEQYSSLAESLANMQLQTKHSTWFRKSKYESLKDAVPELFNEDGTIDMVALEKFVGSDTFKKLSEQNQEYLQHMADDWKIYQDALESVKSYLSDIFGDFGETVSDALVDAFKNGTDAAQVFANSVSEMIEKLAAQMVYAISIGPVLEEAQEEMLKVMKDQNLSDEEKFAKYASIMNKTTDDLISGQQDYNMLLEKWKEIAKEKGIEIFQPDSEKQNTLSKGIQGVTEDTAGVIGSYISAIRADLSVNRNNLQTLVDNAIPFFNEFALRVADLKHLETIANNTGRNADVAQRILDRLVAMTTAGSATRVNIK